MGTIPVSARLLTSTCKIQGSLNNWHWLAPLVCDVELCLYVRTDKFSHQNLAFKEEQPSADQLFLQEKESSLGRSFAFSQEVRNHFKI